MSTRAKGGRPRKPTALKRLQGNPGKRALPKREPEPLAIDDASAPEELDGDALAMWESLAPTLVATRVLTEADVAALMVTCEAWADYRSAARELADGGLVQEAITDRGGSSLRAHPAYAIRSDAWRRFVAGLTDFGMTPASRGKVARAAEPEAPGGLAGLLDGAPPADSNRGGGRRRGAR